MPDYTQQLCDIIKVKLKERDAEQACTLVQMGVPVIPYRTIKNDKKEWKVVPALSSYREQIRKDPEELGEEFWDWLLEEWRQASRNHVDGWGIFLGPPSGYLVMFDFDSEQIKELFNNNKKEWWNKAKTIAELLAINFVTYTGRKNGVNYVTDSSITVATQRGAHVIVKLYKTDWEKLHAVIKANKTLGIVELPPVEDHVEAEGNLELRTLGPTPLSSFKHHIIYLSKPHPFTIKSIEKTLNWLKVKIPQPTSINTYNKGSVTKTDHAITGSATGLNGSNNINRGKKDRTPTVNATNRKLDNEKIAKLVEIITPYWVRGHRNNLLISLLGWIIKNRIDKETALEIVHGITERTGDEEQARRVYEVERHYKMINEGRDIQELTGKTRVLEELQSIIREQNPGLNEEEVRDRAITIISELEQRLGPRHTILVRTLYKTNTWFVNDPRRGIVLLREKVSENGEVKRSREYISDWYIKETLVVREGSRYVYKVFFNNAKTGETVTLTGQLDEIIREQKRMHGVKRSNVVGDAVSAIISELIRRKVAQVKKTAQVAGILSGKHGVKLVRVGALSRLLIPKEVEPEKARKALELLKQIREHYDKDKFDIAINWASYAPISYVLKSLYHIKQVYLLLHGERQTGKTTLARILMSMFPIATNDEEEVPEEAASDYRLAWKLNITTMPVLEDEVQGISRKPALLGIMKRAATGDIIRWRGDTGRKYHARASLILTSNYTEVIEDQALAERMISLLFTQEDYAGSKSREQREEFKRLYIQYRQEAPHLGAVILGTVVGKWPEIAERWIHRLQEKNDYIQLGQQVWQWTAEKLGVPTAEWATREIIIENDVTAMLKEEEVFWTIIREEIRNAINKYRPVIEDLPTDLWNRLKVLAEKGLLPGYTYIRRDGLIVTTPILKELEKYRLPPMGGLPGLAARLGFEYKMWKVRKRTVRGILIPRRALTLEVSTMEELKAEVKNEAMLMLNMKKLEPVFPDIKDYIRKRWGIDEDTAYELARMILEEYEERLEAA